MMDTWLSSVRGRLAADGFVILEDVAFEGQTYAVVARRTRFEITKFGFSESFFIFGEFDRLTTETFRAFSAAAYRCAKAHGVIWLPCGFFESVWCYAVAIAREVDEATLESVGSDTPPRHWASAEIPVIYDKSQGRLAYFEKTPLWGSAYYAGFRSEIQRLLRDGGAV
jgi:hypothetical protein